MEMIVLDLWKKLKAMDSKVISLNEELQDMREKYNELRNGNASKNHLNDDTPMCERHEANDIQSEGVGTYTPYLLDGYGVLGKSSLFFFVGQSIVYGVSLMWIRRILQKKTWRPFGSLFKAKHGNTRPEEDYERVLWGDLKNWLGQAVAISGLPISSQELDHVVLAKAPILREEGNALGWFHRAANTSRS
ncbi:hypothetical protein Tco_0845014 [Tanacetum coccineum]